MRKLTVSVAVIVVAVALLAAFSAEAAPMAPSAKPTTTTSAPPPPSGFTVGWAVVNVDGTLARGSGAVSSVAAGTDGVYFVRFNRDVSQCAYVGAGGEATTFPPDDAIVIGASAGDRGDPNEVSVIEYDAILGADSYSSGFHLIVTC